MSIEERLESLSKAVNRLANAIEALIASQTEGAPDTVQVQFEKPAEDAPELTPAPEPKQAADASEEVDESKAPTQQQVVKQLIKLGNSKGRGAIEQVLKKHKAKTAADLTSPEQRLGAYNDAQALIDG